MASVPNDYRGLLAAPSALRCHRRPESAAACAAPCRSGRRTCVLAAPPAPCELRHRPYKWTTALRRGCWSERPVRRSLLNPRTKSSSARLRLPPAAYLGAVGALLTSIETVMKSRGVFFVSDPQELGLLCDLRDYVACRGGPASGRPLPDLPVPMEFKQIFRDSAEGRVQLHRIGRDSMTTRCFRSSRDTSSSAISLHGANDKDTLRMARSSRQERPGQAVRRGGGGGLAL